MKLNPQLITKKGKGEFVVLPVKEFQAMTDLIEKYEDLRCLRAAKKKSQGQKPIPIKDVIADLGL